MPRRMHLVRNRVEPRVKGTEHMCGPDEAGYDGGEFEPDEALWVPGVDYVGGWRAAQDAGTELLVAFEAAGLDTEGAAAQGYAAADGSGVVRLRLPIATARALAEVIRTVLPDDGDRAAS